MGNWGYNPSKWSYLPGDGVQFYIPKYLWRVTPLVVPLSIFQFDQTCCSMSIFGPSDKALLMNKQP